MNAQEFFLFFFRDLFPLLRFPLLFPSSIGMDWDWDETSKQAESKRKTKTAHNQASMLCYAMLSSSSPLAVIYLFFLPRQDLARKVFRCSI